MKKSKIDYRCYPGILGPVDYENGGNKLNLLRWIIQKLVDLNNWIEIKKEKDIGSN